MCVAMCVWEPDHFAWKLQLIFQASRRGLCGHKDHGVRPQKPIPCCSIVDQQDFSSGYGLVAMTFASHAKGREFDPHYPYV